MIEGQNSLILLLIAFSNVGIEVTVCVCGIVGHFIVHRGTGCTTN